MMRKANEKELLETSHGPACSASEGSPPRRSQGRAHRRGRWMGLFGMGRVGVGPVVAALGALCALMVLGCEPEPKGPPPLSEAAARGHAIFTATANPKCAKCHMLAHAQSTGSLGPNLDERKPEKARVVEVVTNGIKTMPAQKDLSPEQVQDVAAYVYEASRGHGMRAATQ